jgi:hypothetical protein
MVKVHSNQELIFKIISAKNFVLALVLNGSIFVGESGNIGTECPIAATNNVRF